MLATPLLLLGIDRWLAPRLAARHKGATPETLAELLKVDNEAWRGEIPLIEEHFSFIGERLPGELADELRELEKRLAN